LPRFDRRVLTFVGAVSRAPTEVGRSSRASKDSVAQGNTTLRSGRLNRVPPAVVSISLPLAVSGPAARANIQADAVCVVWGLSVRAVVAHRLRPRTTAQLTRGAARQWIASAGNPSSHFGRLLSRSSDNDRRPMREVAPYGPLARCWPTRVVSSRRSACLGLGAPVADPPDHRALLVSGAGHRAEPVSSIVDQPQPDVRAALATRLRTGDVRVCNPCAWADPACVRDGRCVTRAFLSARSPRHSVSPGADSVTLATALYGGADGYPCVGALALR